MLVKSRCTEKNVKLHLTISLDGVGKVHDETRGVRGGFERTVKTIRLLKENINAYCDSFDLGYTISKRNATDMVFAKEFAELLGIDIYFHLAVPNKRINTFGSEDYSVLRNKKATFLAREFFYGEFVENPSVKKQIKSFINYHFLKNNQQERIALCNYLNRDVTIDQSLNLYLCATASDKVGNLMDSSIKKYIKSGKIKQECDKVKKNCKNCIHYANAPTFKGSYIFIKEKYAKINLLIYLLRSRLHLI